MLYSRDQGELRKRQPTFGAKMNEIHEGGCACGSVHYCTVGEPITATVCHCRFCQRRSGSVFAEPVLVRMEQTELCGGPLVTYGHRSDESGRRPRLEFCPRCGTTVTWTVERRPGVRSIAGGTFDDPNWLRIARHIWTRSAQPWMPIAADVVCLEKGTPA
jgi:hypothetical protein